MSDATAATPDLIARLRRMANDKAAGMVSPYREALAEAADALEAAPKPESLLRNLLAVIHRDGGHYTEEHGLTKATEDAMTAWWDRAATILDLEARPSIGDCISHRCSEHYAVPTQNHNEFSGSECGGCIVARAEAAEAALREYGWHTAECANVRIQNDDVDEAACICGFTAALAQPTTETTNEHP